MNNRRLALLVLAVVFAALLLFGARGLLNRKEARAYNRVTSNLQNYWLHDDAVYFYTGSFFAKYNLKTNNVERLSDYTYIQNSLTGVSWSPDAVIFQSSASGTDRDDVTTAAQNLGVKPYLPHWWRYDFKAKQYQLLYYSGIDGCDALLQLKGQQLACIKPQVFGGGTYELDMFDGVSKSSKKLLESDDPISGLQTDGGNVYFIVSRLDGGQSLKSIDVSTGSARELYKGDGAITYTVSGSGDVLLDESPAQDKADPNGSSEEQKNKPVVTVNKVAFITAGQKTIDKKFKSSQLTPYVESGKLFLSSIDGSVRSADSQGINTLDKATKDSLEAGDFLFKNDNVFYVIKSNGVLLSSSTAHGSYKDPSDFNSAFDNDHTGNSWVDDEQNGARQAFIYLNKKPSAEQEGVVLDNIDKNGFRSSEFNLKWVLQGPDYSVPIRPQAVIIK